MQDLRDHSYRSLVFLQASLIFSGALVAHRIGCGTFIRFPALIAESVLVYGLVFLLSLLPLLKTRLLITVLTTQISSHYLLGAGTSMHMSGMHMSGMNMSGMNMSGMNMSGSRMFYSHLLMGMLTFWIVYQSEIIWKLSHATLNFVMPTSFVRIATPTFKEICIHFQDFFFVGRIGLSESSLRAPPAFIA